MFDDPPRAAHTAAPPDLPWPQHLLYAESLRKMGVSLRTHVGPDHSARVICRRFAVLGRVGLISRGPVWQGAPDPQALAGLRKRLGLHHLLITPEDAAGAQALRKAGFVQVAPAATLADLHLAGGPGDWLARMSGKWRNRLQHARKQGLAIEMTRFCPTRHGWLLRRDGQQRIARGYRALPPEFTDALSALAPGALQIAIARDQAGPVAGMLFIRHGRVAVYHIGWTGPRGRSSSAHNLLLFHAMTQFSQDGVERIELGCVSARTPGLTRFKHGAGARLRGLGGTWAQSCALGPVHGLLRLVNAPPRATAARAPAGSP